MKTKKWLVHQPTEEVRKIRKIYTIVKFAFQFVSVFLEHTFLCVEYSNIHFKICTSWSLRINNLLHVLHLLFVRYRLSGRKSNNKKYNTQTYYRPAFLWSGSEPPGLITYLLCNIIRRTVLRLNLRNSNNMVWRMINIIQIRPLLHLHPICHNKWGYYEIRISWRIELMNLVENYLLFPKDFQKIFKLPKSLMNNSKIYFNLKLTKNIDRDGRTG